MLALACLLLRAARVGLAGEYIDPISKITAQDEALYSAFRHRDGARRRLVDAALHGAIRTLQTAATGLGRRDFQQTLRCFATVPETSNGDPVGDRRGVHLPMGGRTRRLAGRRRGRRASTFQSPVANAGRLVHDRRSAARLLRRRVLCPLLGPVAGIARIALRLLGRGGRGHPDQGDRGHRYRCWCWGCIGWRSAGRSVQPSHASAQPQCWRWGSPPPGFSTN